MRAGVQVLKKERARLVVLGDGHGSYFTHVLSEFFKKDLRVGGELALEEKFAGDPEYCAVELLRW